MGGPIEGWLMVRYRGAMPFVIQVKEMLNAVPHPHGPFICLEPTPSPEGQP